MKMKEKIQKILADIEVARTAKVLFAVEASSRAWGFNAEDSDYDVRFVYCKALQHYVQIGSPKDTIHETHGNIDLVGWDIRKALNLVVKGNPQINEWLGSGIIYRNDLLGDFARFAARGKNPIATRYHYLKLVEKFDKRYRDAATVPVKAYLHVARDALASQWVRTKRTIPPVEIHALCEDDRLRDFLDQLIQLRREGVEETGYRHVKLENLISQEKNAEHDDTLKPVRDHELISDANQLFRSIVGLRR